MAKYKKKRARELQHDRFRDTTMTVVDRLGDRLEGKGKAILYGLLGMLILAVLVGLFLKWNHKKDDEARRALGRAISISTAALSSAPAPDPSAPTFPSERERAQRSVEEFQKVAAKYGDPYRSEARYFEATNLLLLDRNRAIGQLADLSKGGEKDVATLAKFALAQAKESDSKFDEAAQLYKELASQNSMIVTSETANLRLALVYDKQGKKKEAADLLFNIVQAARSAKDADGSPAAETGAAREAAKELQRIDLARYAQLTPEAPRSDLFF